MILEHNGNRLAFLGANQWGPEWYREQARRHRQRLGRTGESRRAPLRPEADGRRHPGAQDRKSDLVFAEVQHTEFNAAGDYQIEPLPQEEADFQALSDGGRRRGDRRHGARAAGRRAAGWHGIILYGLGNLYFDQTWSWPTRTGLVARHTIYDGKLINTELLVTVIEDNFQLRWATPEESDAGAQVGVRREPVVGARRFQTASLRGGPQPDRGASFGRSNP